MNKILNYGSVNIDYVYSVEHIAAPKETVASGKRETYPGGKGLNQSIALARAGADVYHAGAIGSDGEWLRETLRRASVKPDFLFAVDTPTGNAIIQVDPAGQNCIILYAGANRCQTDAMIDEALACFDTGDLLLLQNEINHVDLLIEKAHAKGMTVVLNPSPVDDALLTCDLRKVDIFILNEVEGNQLTGHIDAMQILHTLFQRFPSSRIVLTLGEKGALYRDARKELFQPSYPARVADTTAAGDTFTGYFLASVLRGYTESDALRIAARASAYVVERQGASCSIPLWAEVEPDMPPSR